MNKDKYHCPKCKLLFDYKNHIPRNLNCGHTLCSYCIIEQLHSSKNSISCPIDKTVYNNIVSIDSFKENTNLIEEIQEYLDIPINHNYEISNEDIFFDNDKSIMNSDKFNDSFNSMTLNASIISSSNCYYKKSKVVRNSIKETNNKMCEKHTLPLNVICIDEKIKICSQCALNNDHVNHQIITEDEFMNNIDTLIDLFQEIDNNQNKYLSFNNINTKLILDNIANNIDNYIETINKTKNDMINNINLQCETVEKYLNNRKKEIFEKYQSINFDISNLRESTLNWMQNVTYKLDQLNEIKTGDNKGCIKLLDNDINKNIFNLIRNGKQLNGRYNFVQQNIKLIDKLKNFDKNGINITPNKNIIDRLYISNKNEENNNENNENKKENKENENIIDINLNIDEIGKKDDINNKNQKQNNNEIKSTLFIIKENNDLINSLNLTKFKFDFIDNTLIDKRENKDKINHNVKKDEINHNEKKEKLEKEEKSEKKENIEIKNDIKAMTFNNKKENNNLENENVIININENNKKENNNNNNDNITNDNENKVDKNNMSKIIEEVTFNDDTLLINPLTTNQNDNIYHKKIKKDKPLELKLKKKDNSITKKEVSTQLVTEDQIQSKNKYKGITTKKIDISELRNHKLSIDNRSFDKEIKGNFYNLNNSSSKNLKKEIVININKRKTEHKKTLQVGINKVKQSKKNLFKKQNSG